MYFTLRRIWGVIAFFISLAIGSFLATNIGLGNDWGYSLGCILGVVIWAVGATLLSTSIGSEKAEKKYLDTLKHSTDQLKESAPSKENKNTSVATNYCPHCGKPVSISDQFCRACGKSLT